MQLCSEMCTILCGHCGAYRITTVWEMSMSLTMIPPKPLHSSYGHARRCISRIRRTYICNHAYDNPTTSKASICESMRKKVLRPRHFTMVDHCQNGPAPQNLSCWVLETSFLSTSNPKHYKANNICPWKQSRSRS